MLGCLNGEVLTRILASGLVYVANVCMKRALVGVESNWRWFLNNYVRLQLSCREIA